MITTREKNLLASGIAFLGLITAAPNGFALCLGLAESAAENCFRFTESDPLPEGCAGTNLDEVIICLNPDGCVINGGGGNDVLVGAEEGDDRLCGAGRKDALDGLGGNDVLSGGGGLDALSGDLGQDILFGDGGPDVLVGGPGEDVSNGGSTGGRNRDVCIQNEVTEECEVVFR